MAPTRVFTWVSAQRPKAAEPPALFISATMIPSRIRNRKMPTFQASATPEIRPSLMMVSSAPMGEKFAASRPPTTMPRKREE